MIRRPVVARHDTVLAGDGHNLISVLHTLYTTDRRFEKSVTLAMIAAFGEDFDKLVFPPAADNQVQLRIRWKTLRQEQSASDISDGDAPISVLTYNSGPSKSGIIDRDR